MASESALLFRLRPLSYKSRRLATLMFGVSAHEASKVSSVEFAGKWHDVGFRATTRVGMVILASVFGMSFGGWVSGVIFDSTGSYAAAFTNGLAWNALNIAIMAGLLIRARQRLALA
jgi:hypothetical protein